MGLKWDKEPKEVRVPYGLFVREGEGNWRLSDFEAILTDLSAETTGIQWGEALKVAILGSVAPVGSVNEGFRREVVEQSLDFSIVSDEDEADIVLRLEKERYYLSLPHDTKPLTEQFKPEPTNGRIFHEHFLTTLAHINQWKRFRDAHNSQSENDRLAFRIFQLIPNGPEQQVLQDHEAVLNMTHDLDSNTPRVHLRLEMENVSGQDLYTRVYHVSVMFAINRRGIFDYEGEYIRAGEVRSTTVPQRPSKSSSAQSSGSPASYRYLAFDLPEHVRNWEWESYQEHIIILTSPTPFEINGLEQNYLLPPKTEPNPNPAGAEKERYVLPELPEGVQIQTCRLTFNNPFFRQKVMEEVEAESFEPVAYKAVAPVDRPAVYMAYNINAAKEYDSQFNRESNDIFQALKGLGSGIHYQQKEFESEEDLISSLSETRERVTILHLSIQRPQGSQEYLNDLAILRNILPSLPSLVLLFLHAAIDREELVQIQSLDSCPPFILTLRPNPQGEIEARFIAGFYQRLGGTGLVRSFEETAEAMQFEIFGRKSLPFGFENFDPEKDEFPWQLHENDKGAGLGAWNLVAAAGKSLLGTPEIPSEFAFPEYPFPGLRPYTSKHAQLYFGRNPYISLLYQLFDYSGGPPVILLSGRSGVGKTSLLDAGVMPRLQGGNQNFLYLTPTDGPSLDKLLMNSLQAYPGVSGQKDILSAWQAAERASGILHIIVDPSVLSVTMNAGEDPYGLADLFRDKTNRPQGKLLLCYRNDQHESVSEAVQHFQWKSAHVRLPRPDREVLMNILSFYELNKEVQSRWGISFEESLKEIIADHLMVIDQEPILPTFQILMKPWWENKQASESGSPGFSYEEYQRFRKEGYSLEQYTRQQLDRLRYRSGASIAVSGGILLELLHYHVQENGQLLPRNVPEMTKRYRGSGYGLKILLEAELLIERGTDTTTLVHEVLGPVVRRLYEQSELAIPTTHRLFDQGVAKYREDKSALLDQEVLDLLDKNAGDLRQFTEEEEALIQASRDRLKGDASAYSALA